jgi:hypothetical protein
MKCQDIEEQSKNMRRNRKKNSYSPFFNRCMNVMGVLSRCRHKEQLIHLYIYVFVKRCNKHIYRNEM